MRNFTVLLLVLTLFSVFWATDAQSEKPMIMPVAVPAGASTWLFGQAYGNTPGAYNFGDEWYSAGQGLHFGIDLSMPCGTPLVAVADGVVAFADDLGFGAGPHNLILRHDALNATSLYGHLQGYPPVRPGQTVKQGDLVGYSGDPDSTCFSRPHLHFEVRSMDYQATYNPIDWIEADWNALALVGAYSGHLFQGDMDNARRWMSLDDQPDIRFWGARLNDYRAVYPAGNGQNAPTNPLLQRELPALDLTMTWTARTIGSGRCCWQNFWHPTDPIGLYSIDGEAGQRANLYRWDIEQPMMSEVVEAAPPAQKSPDWAFRMWMDGESVVMIRQSDGAEFRTVTGGELPSLNPSNTRLLWVESAPTVPGQARAGSSVKVTNFGGAAALEIFNGAGANAQWIDDSRVILTLPGEERTTRVLLHNVDDGTQTDLGTYFWMRGLSVSPGGTWALFILSNQADSALSGVYALNLQESGTQPQLMPWFGSWRWRDSDELYVIPMETSADVTQTLHHYDLTTGVQTQLLTPAFTVMNGDWSVSSDGNRIAYREANTVELTLLELKP